jgi:uncharacterized membrane protein
MAEHLSHTQHDDAPLSAAKDPDPRAVYADVDEGDVLVARSVTINRPREALFRFWRDFTNLPLFMENLHSVTVRDSVRSHWVIAAPAGKTVEWDALITHEEPGASIEWESVEGASIRNTGRVEFIDSPDNRGTVVRITLVYDPPGGMLGQMVAKLFQREPKIQARQDLRRFKQLMETGEIATARPPAAAPRA